MSRIGAREWPRPGYEWGEPSGSEAATTGARARRSLGMPGLPSPDSEWHDRDVQGEGCAFALSASGETGAPMGPSWIAGTRPLPANALENVASGLRLSAECAFLRQAQSWTAGAHAGGWMLGMMRMGARNTPRRVAITARAVRGLRRDCARRLPFAPKSSRLDGAVAGFG